MIRKKHVIMFYGILALILVLIIGGFIYRVHKGSMDIIETKTSPDGKHVVYACLTNGGVTTDFGVSVILLNSNNRLMWYTNANVLSAYHTSSVNVYWTSNNVLAVTYSKDATIILKKSKVNGINISYSNDLPKYSD